MATIACIGYSAESDHFRITTDDPLARYKEFDVLLDPALTTVELCAPEIQGYCQENNEAIVRVVCDYILNVLHLATHH